MLVALSPQMKPLPPLWVKMISSVAVPNGHLGHLHLLEAVFDVTVDTGVQISEFLLSILVGAYPEVGLLGPMVVLFLIV